MDFITLFFLISAAITIVTGAHYLWKLFLSRELRKLNWRDIRRGVLVIISRLRHDNFIPDLVIGVGRSGAILGGLIAGNMGNLPLAVVDRKLQWDERKRDILLSEFTELKVGPERQKLLFVIGEVYSAQSIVEVLKHLDPILKDKQYRTATLVKLESAPVNIDYIAFKVSKKVEPAWVMSPDYKRL